MVIFCQCDPTSVFQCNGINSTIPKGLLRSGLAPSLSRSVASAGHLRPSAGLLQCRHFHRNEPQPVGQALKKNQCVGIALFLLAGNEGEREMWIVYGL